ncbi:MAG: hypothetical protein CMJ64_05710 [Planctomycetaceae bacterium]|jgi:Uma2 family endonuclease|nr:hypothetical protein [Planctomycetaceae bacterium]
MATGSLLIDGGVRVPTDIYDLEGFRRWAHSDQFPESGRFSYLNGEVFADMAPEELQTHNKLKGVVTTYLTLWAASHDIGEVLPDGALVVNEQADVSNEPDVMFVSWESLENRTVRYAEVVEGSERYVEVVGSPDLVVEVVSKSSTYKDNTALPPLYYAAGVREYWLIDARGGEISFLLKRCGDDDWIDVEPDQDGYRNSEVLGGAFLLTRDLNRVGGYRYELRSREV